MKKPEFLVVPDNIVSKHDGDTHYISAYQLMQLYGVRRNECVILRHTGEWPRHEGLYILDPKYDGDYELPDVYDDPCEQYHSSDSVCQLAVMQACAFISQSVGI